METTAMDKTFWLLNSEFRSQESESRMQKTCAYHLELTGI